MFYDRLVKECKRQGKKITPTIEKAGGDRGQISNYKKGSMPNGTFLKKLADYLNVSTDYLLELTDNPNPPSKDYSMVNMLNDKLVMLSPDSLKEAETFINYLLSKETKID